MKSVDKLPSHEGKLKQAWSFREAKISKQEISLLITIANDNEIIKDGVLIVGGCMKLSKILPQSLKSDQGSIEKLCQTVGIITDNVEVTKQGVESFKSGMISYFSGAGVKIIKGDIISPIRKVGFSVYDVMKDIEEKEEAEKRKTILAEEVLNQEDQKKKENKQDNKDTVKQQPANDNVKNSDKYKNYNEEFDLPMTKEIKLRSEIFANIEANNRLSDQDKAILKKEFKNFAWKNVDEQISQLRGIREQVNGGVVSVVNSANAATLTPILAAEALEAIELTAISSSAAGPVGAAAILGLAYVLSQSDSKIHHPVFKRENPDNGRFTIIKDQFGAMTIEYPDGSYQELSQQGYSELKNFYGEQNIINSNPFVEYVIVGETEIDGKLITPIPKERKPNAPGFDIHEGQDKAKIQETPATENKPIVHSTPINDQKADIEGFDIHAGDDLSILTFKTNDELKKFKIEGNEDWVRDYNDWLDTVDPTKLQGHHVFSDKNGLIYKEDKDGSIEMHPIFEEGILDPKILKDKNNLMLLPKEHGVHETASVHRGRHLDNVIKDLSQQLTDLKAEVDLSNIEKSAVTEEFQKIIKQEKGKLYRGEIKLNNKG